MMTVVNHNFSGRATPLSIDTHAIRSTRESKSAWMLAMEEEEKNVHQLQQKEIRLQEFQNRVKRRVAVIRQNKRQKELQDSMKELDVAQNVARKCINSKLLLNEQNIDKDSQNEHLPVSPEYMDFKPKQNKPSLHSNLDIIVLKSAKPTKSKIPDDLKESEKSFSLYCEKMVQNFNCGIGAKSNKIENEKQQKMQRVLTRKMCMELDRKKIKMVQERNYINARQLISFCESRWSKKFPHDSSIQKCQSKTETLEKEIKDWSKNHSKKNNLDIYYERLVFYLQQKIKQRCQQLSINIPRLCACTKNSKNASWINCADNCRFYKNPSVYHDALRSLAQSLEKKYS